jgi:hypothetical protein
MFFRHSPNFMRQLGLFIFIFDYLIKQSGNRANQAPYDASYHSHLLNLNRWEY